MPTRSLRTRVIIGSVLWTFGLIAAVIIAVTIYHFHYNVYLILHTALLFALAAASMIAGFAELRGGLEPFKLLRETLSNVRAGRASRVDGSYPAEVQPLVEDLNELLDHREAAVRRALAKAGDLAHGLKTPLAVLGQEADRLRAAGHVELADVIEQQVTRMQRQVEYHIAHARAAASGATLGSHCLVRDSVEGLRRTLLRLHADRGLSIDQQIPADVSVPCQREDLDEMLGNLLDNACKWARSRVVISAIRTGTAVTIAVDDDGRGLEASLRNVVLQRGVRADEAAPGSGFGLAIVRELAELYGGRIAIDASPMGGVRATLELPVDGAAQPSEHDK